MIGRWLRGGGRGGERLGDRGTRLLRPDRLRWRLLLRRLRLRWRLLLLLLLRLELTKARGLRLLKLLRLVLYRVASSLRLHLRILEALLLSIARKPSLLRLHRWSAKAGRLGCERRLPRARLELRVERGILTITTGAGAGAVGAAQEGIGLAVHDKRRDYAKRKIETTMGRDEIVTRRSSEPGHGRWYDTRRRG